MLNESGQGMNEAEMSLIRSPLLCSALQPRKHQNDLLFLCRSQKPLDVSYFGRGLFFPDFHVSQWVSDWPEMCASISYKHVRTQIRTKQNINSDIHKLLLSEECSGYRDVSRHQAMMRSDSVCVCISVYICKVAVREEKERNTKKKKKRRRRRGLCGESDWQSSRLKRASRFYNQLRNVDMNRLLLFYTEQRWATSSNYLYLTTFKAFCYLLTLFLLSTTAISVSIVPSSTSPL